MHLSLLTFNNASAFLLRTSAILPEAISFSILYNIKYLCCWKFIRRYPRLCKRELSHTFKLLATFFNFLIVSSKSSSTFFAACLFFLAKSKYCTNWFKSSSIFLGEKQILYKLVQVFFCFSCYNAFIIHIFLSYPKLHHLHFGNFPFLKILWIIPVFEASLLLS